MKEFLRKLVPNPPKEAKAGSGGGLFGSMKSACSAFDGAFALIKGVHSQAHKVVQHFRGASVRSSCSQVSVDFSNALPLEALWSTPAHTPSRALVREDWNSLLEALWA